MIAASLIVLVNASHSDQSDTSGLLRPVLTALGIFETHSASSDLAKKGIVVLRNLIRTIENPAGSGSGGDDVPSGEFVGSAGKDLKRAIGILRRKRHSPSTSIGTEITIRPLHESRGPVSISPEDRTVPIPVWRPDWATSIPIIYPLLDVSETTNQEHDLGELQMDDLFDRLFGGGDDSGMWNHRGLDLG